MPCGSGRLPASRWAPTGARPYPRGQMSSGIQPWLSRTLGEISGSNATCTRDCFATGHTSIRMPIERRSEQREAVSVITGRIRAIMTRGEPPHPQ